MIYFKECRIIKQSYYTFLTYLILDNRRGENNWSNKYWSTHSAYLKNRKKCPYSFVIISLLILIQCLGKGTGHFIQSTRSTKNERYRIN